MSKQGRKRKTISELQRELEELKTKHQKLEKDNTAGAAFAGPSEGNSNRNQAPVARDPDRSSLDESYISAKTAKQPLNLGIWDKVPRNNKSHSQQSAIYIPPHAIKLKKNPPSSLDDNKDKNQRKKPSSSGPSHLGKIIAPQTFIKKTNISASSTTMNNNTVQLSVAQNNLCPKRLQTVLQDGLSGIEKYYLQQKYKIPNNYSFMKAPSLNEEVFPFMDERAKILDSRLFNQQEMLSTCMAALLEGLASAPSGGGFRAAKENLHAGLHLLADLHNELTKARRNVIDSNLKSFLLKKIGQGRADFEDVNHDIKRDDTVFGREIGNLLRKELLEQFRQK